MQVIEPQTPPPFGFAPVFARQTYPSYPLSKQTNVPYSANALPLTPPASPSLPSTSSLSPSYPAGNSKAQYRRLTDNELSYFLPGRADGVNDMYVHHRLAAQHPAYFDQDRILHIWAYLLLSHPLLCSSIYVQSYEDAHFVHHPPANLSQALQQASERFKVVKTYPGKSMVDQYLNGPRTLSAEKLSCLVVALPEQELVGRFGLPTPPSSPGQDNDDDVADRDPNEAEFMLCATHAIGDGMALHTFMNDFYTMLGSDRSVFQIQEMISDAVRPVSPTVIPQGLENRLPAQTSRWQSIVQRSDYRTDQTRLAGNQTFPTASCKPRRTVVPTHAYSAADTKRMLATCKGNGVTVAHVMFALCNVAWSMMAPSQRDACVIYSAANLRSQLPRDPLLSPESYFHLAIGYFNISLPSLLPPALSQSELLWHRAQSVKRQMIKTTRSPFVVSRFKQEAAIRKERAVKWAKVDDGVVELRDPVPPTASSSPKPAHPPAKALMGVSMLGNLDGMYKHVNFPTLKLKSLMTGSRQRSSGLLLFSYTFQEQLWVSLGYDINGFKEGVIEEFWERVNGLIRDVMLRQD